ncbi:lipopolysaccharide-binding protein-like isoform X2 [Clavelina lepadiformis]|uniref:lipopolysaccharide-binding protein-like isoform X2 n=1 Tax=Clavelina lepadiformis TaxID=159417 RepID=UPI004042AFE2
MDLNWNSKLITKVRDLANQYAQSNLGKLEIPDFDGTYDFSSGGSANYEFSNIKIPHLNPGNILLIPTPPNIVTMSMSGTKISVSGNWKASGSFPITIFGVSVPLQLEDRGTFLIKVSGASLSQSVDPGFNSSNGKPTMTAVDCSASLGKLTLDVDSKFGGIVSFLINIASDTIKSFLENELCPGIQTVVAGQATQYIESTPIIALLIFETSVYLGLVCQPVATNKYVQFLNRGKCFPNKNPDVVYNFNPTTTPPLTLTNEMARVSVSDYVVNTFLESLLINEFFNFQVNADEISDFLENDLTVIFLTTFIPALKQPHFMGRPIRIKTYPASPATTQFVPGKIRFMGRYAMDLQVVLDNGTIDEIATATAQLLANVTVELNGTTLFPQFELPKIASLTAEGLSADLLKSILDTLLANTIGPALNGFLGKGYELPRAIGIMAFDGPSLEIKEGAFEMGTDLKLAD